MKATVITILRITRNQIRNLTKLMSGRPVTMPSLGSMTLGLDDVSIAKKLLKTRENWCDENVVSQYERRFAQWNGSKFAFAFTGGRVALSACLDALQLNEGNEVLLPGYTCVVVPNAIRYAGLTPVYVDIELDTYGLDAEKIEQKITPRTKAIILHHLYGLVCRDYEEIVAIARKYKLKVIEDCAHSTGAEFKGKKVGNLGDMAFYSSEQSKVFNTIQGGVAVTNSSDLANKIRKYYQQCTTPSNDLIFKQISNVILNYYKFADPARWWKGDIAELFYSRHRIISTTKEEELGIKPENYGQRMPAAIATLGINQLSKIDAHNQQRRIAAAKWDKWCDAKGYTKPVVVKHSTPVYLRYPVLVKENEKKDLSWAVKALGVHPGVWFVSNVHPVKVHVEDCQNADEATRKCINFPCLGVIDE
jgi:dTDP-4-amino-4,6-dideoxygalactose transaminase